jgi:hypothetical protein
MVIKVLACRGFTRRSILSYFSSRQVQVDEPIGLVEYQGVGTVDGQGVTIHSCEPNGVGKSKTRLRRIPMSNVIRLEQLT